MYTTMTSFLQFSKVNEIIKHQTHLMFSLNYRTESDKRINQYHKDYCKQLKLLTENRFVLLFSLKSP